MKMTDDPRSIEDLRENEEQYEERLEMRNEEMPGSMGSNVLLPRSPSEVACRAFHELMTEHGAAGVEYAQEGLHGNGEYFEYFDSVGEALDDFELYKQNW